MAGGSSGINLGIAERFAEMGARLALISRSEGRVAAAVEQIRSTGVECIGMAADVRDYATVSGALEHPPRFAGKIAFITGGTQGIGPATASAFLKAGAEVRVTGTRSSPGEYAGDLSRFRYYRVRLELPEEREALADRFERLVILVNNAAAVGGDEYGLDGFRRIIEINQFAPVDFSFRFRERPSRSRGVIVNVASIGGFIALCD